jgi:hypothetical protein
MLERVQTEETVAATAKITCNAAANINVAFYQNAVPIMRELAVENRLGRDLTDICVHLAAEPPFLTQPAKPPPMAGRKPAVLQLQE